MKPEELNSALERLWAKVAEPKQPDSLPPLPGYDPEPASRGAALEALALIKRQHREQQARWQRAIEIKDADVQALTEALRRAESELETLRARALGFESRLAEEIGTMAQKLEAAHGLLLEQERRSQIEEARLAEALESARAENLRLSANRAELQAELKREQERSAKSEKIYEQSSREMQAAQSASREARAAVAATLSELLDERQGRELAQERGDELQARLRDITERFSRMEKLWEEERRQWTELWNRERRSSRES